MYNSGIMPRQQRSTVLVLAAVLTSAGLGLFRTVLQAQSQRDACDRACLNGHMNGYLTALVARDPSNVPTTPTLKFTENSTTLKLGEGAWKTATFSITDGTFQNRQEGGSDFRIYNGGGSDLTVSFVRLVKHTSSPAGTPPPRAGRTGRSRGSPRSIQRCPAPRVCPRRHKFSSAAGGRRT